MCVVASTLLISCQKTNIGSDVGVYPDTSSQAAVKFLSARVAPTSGAAGTVVTVQVSGLNGLENKFKVYVGATEAKVLTVGASSITISVPQNASTGNIKIELNNEVFYGPKFSVSGKVYIDPDFNVDKFQAIGAIRGIVANNQGFVLYGGITQYAGGSFSGITFIEATGDTSKLQPYFGPLTSPRLSPGVVNSVVSLDDGSFLIGGGFSSGYTYQNVQLESLNGVARLFVTGSAIGIDTLSYQVPNADPHNFPERSNVTGSAINGGVEGTVRSAFVSSDGKHYIVVGDFDKYVSTYYDGSLYNSFQQDRVQMNQLVSMQTDGTFDSTFNYNYATKKSYSATNAIINDAIQAADGNIILVGSFTSYNGVSANRIVKVNASTGAVVTGFSMGSGFDGLVTSIKYNQSLHRYMVTGLFKTYNGVPANCVAMLKDDGTLDASFSPKVFTDGFPTFAKQLDNGLIICAGGFTSYDNISRAGFAVLNKDGSLASGYNNTGNFSGIVYDLIETTSQLTGQNAIFLVGVFNRFDATAVSNIVKVVIEK